MIFVWPRRMASVSVRQGGGGAFVICFIGQLWTKRSKHGLLVFPPKKIPMWRRHCTIGQSCCTMTSKRSIGWFLQSSLGMKFFTWAFAYPTKSHMRLYPFNKPIKSFYFCSFVVSVLVVHFHFKVIKKSLLCQNVQKLKWNHELQVSGTRFINLTWSSGDSGYTHYTW